jgi:hypothetical protein
MSEEVSVELLRSKKIALIASYKQKQDLYRKQTEALRAECQ